MTEVVRSRDDGRADLARRGTGDLRGKRILYVDDDGLLRRAASRLFRGAGASCLLAGTHEQALTMAADEPELTLALLDYHMPDGSVGNLVYRLRVVNPALPLIGTSGLDRHREFSQHGVSQFIAKPWRLADLRQIVESVSPTTSRVPVAMPRKPSISVLLPGD